MDLHIVLYEPEIPQNTGSIGRTCMAVGAVLHLIEPLGFSLEDKYLKRAGLDYWRNLDWRLHKSWDDFLSAHPGAPMWFYSTKAVKRYDQAAYSEEAFLIFGKETAGLPESLIKQHPGRTLRIPLCAQARSLNLSVAVGVAAFEALKSQNFSGLSASDPEQRVFPAQ